MSPLTKEAWHCGRRPEVLGVLNPIVQEFGTQLIFHMSKTRADFSQITRSFNILKIRDLIMRCLGQNRVCCESIFLEECQQFVPHVIPFRVIDQLINPALFFLIQFFEGRIAFHLGSSRKIVRLQTHVRTDPLVRSLVPVNLVAAKTAISKNQIVTMSKFRRRGLFKPISQLELDHFVMTLQTGAFRETFRIHWVDPVVVVKPTILLRPAPLLFGVIRRVRDPLKLGGTPLPFVTD